MPIWKQIQLPLSNIICLLRVFFFFILRYPYILPFRFYQSWALLFLLISNTYCQGAAIPLFWGQRSGSPLWFSRWSILPEDTLLADRINSLLIRLGPSIVFPFPALSSFIILRNHKKSISSSLYQMIESFSWLHVQTQCSACSPEWCLATMCIYQVLWCIWTMNHQKGDPTSKNSVRLWRSGSFVSEALVEGELSAES